MHEYTQADPHDSTALPPTATTSPTRTTDAALLLGGASALALGSFLPWETVTAPLFGTVTANGMQAGGLFTLASAGTILAISRRVRREQLSRRAAVGVFAAVAVALLVIVVKFAVVMNDASKAHGIAAVSAGSGLYLCAAASVAIAVGAARAYKSG